MCPEYPVMVVLTLPAVGPWATTDEHENVPGEEEEVVKLKVSGSEEGMELWTVEDWDADASLHRFCRDKRRLFVSRSLQTTFAGFFLQGMRGKVSEKNKTIRKTAIFS